MKYAICYLSTVPVRKDPSDASEMVSQLLFGETCEITGITEDSKWVRVKNDFDGYEGWVDPKQIEELDQVDHLRLFTEKASYILEGPMQCNTGEKLLILSVGSRLPLFEKGKFDLSGKEMAFGGKAGLHGKKQVLHVASQFLGVPYLWGGRSQFGIDCSGFVQQVFKLCGKMLPRDAYQQAEVGDTINLQDAKPGDLAFFSNDSGKVIHVGIVLESGNIIHAHGEVRIDLLDEKGIYNTVKKYHSHKLSCLKRIFV